MKNNLIAACLQLTSSSDINKNLKETIDLSNKAIDKIVHLTPSQPKLLLILSKTVLNETIPQLESAQHW